jgi:hypothetical protein
LISHFVTLATFVKFLGQTWNLRAAQALGPPQFRPIASQSLAFEKSADGGSNQQVRIPEGESEPLRWAGVSSYRSRTVCGESNRNGFSQFVPNGCCEVVSKAGAFVIRPAFKFIAPIPDIRRMEDGEAVSPLQDSDPSPEQLLSPRTAEESS